jgi:hypothetical protein
MDTSPQRVAIDPGSPWLAVHSSALRHARWRRFGDPVAARGVDRRAVREVDRAQRPSRRPRLGCARSGEGCSSGAGAGGHLTTVHNYVVLRALWREASDAECPFMPVLQGYAVEDYLRW